MATERKASRAVPALPVKGCTSPYSTIISISTSSTGSCVMNKIRVYTNSSSTIFAVLADMHNNEVGHQYSNTIMLDIVTAVIESIQLCWSQ